MISDIDKIIEICKAWMEGFVPENEIEEDFFFDFKRIYKRAIKIKASLIK